MTYFGIRRAKLALAGLLLLIVGMTILADSGHGRAFFAMIQRIPGGDKLGHFALFGPLSFLINLLWRGSEFRIGPARVLRGSLLLAILVVLEECSQKFFPTRTFDLKDLAADFLGIFIFGRLARHYLAAQRSACRPALIRSPASHASRPR
ncbi:MAG: VanZ family protein [Verrucomicrobiota bacterium]